MPAPRWSQQWFAIARPYGSSISMTPSLGVSGGLIVKGSKAKSFKSSPLRTAMFWLCMRGRRSLLVAFRKSLERSLSDLPAAPPPVYRCALRLAFHSLRRLPSFLLSSWVLHRHSRPPASECALVTLIISPSPSSQDHPFCGRIFCHFHRPSRCPPTMLQLVQRPSSRRHTCPSQAFHTPTECCFEHFDSLKFQHVAFVLQHLPVASLSLSPVVV